MGVPTFMYRRAEDGSVESRVFDSDAIPEGWVDSPAKVEEMPVVKARKGKRNAPQPVPDARD